MPAAVLLPEGAAAKQSWHGKTGRNQTEGLKQALYCPAGMLCCRV